MQQIKSAALSLDFFGLLPFWLVNGTGKFRTPFGALMSFFIIAFMIWQVAVQFYGLFSRENVNVVQYTWQGKVIQEQWDITPQNFLWVFAWQVPGTTGTNTTIPDPQYVSVTATVHTGTGKYQVQLVDCQPSGLEQVFQYEGNLMCIDPNGPNIEMQGIDGYFDISFTACQNSTSGNTCAPLNEIESYISSAELWVFFQAYFVDPTNYTTPIQNAGWNSFTEVFADPTQKKDVVYTFSKIVVETDDGYLSSNNYELGQIEQDIYFIESTNINLSNTPKFIDLAIYTSGNELYISRVFQKIPQVLAAINGLMSTILVLIAIVVVPYQKLRMYEQLGKKTLFYRLNVSGAQPTNEDSNLPKSYKQNDKKFVTHLQNINTSTKLDISENVQEPLEEKIQIKFSNSPPYQAQSKMYKKSKLVRAITEPDSIDFGRKLRIANSFIESPAQLQEKTLNGLDEPSSLIIHGSESSLITAHHQILEFSHCSNQPEKESQSQSKRANIMRSNGNQPNQRQQTLNLLKEEDSDANSIHLKDWIKSLFVKTDKVEIIKKIKEEIENTLDVSNVLQELTQLRVLKCLLLSKRERILFDYLFNSSVKSKPREIYDSFRADTSNIKILEDTLKDVDSDPLKTVYEKRLLNCYQGI